MIRNRFAEAFSVLPLLLALTFFSFTSHAAGATIFGPQQYTQNGSSDTYTNTFAATQGQGTLIVLNGQAGGQKRVSSATVKINGQTIFSESNFGQSVYQLQATVNLLTSNTLEVTLKNNKKGSYITVEVQQGAAPPPTVSTVNLFLLPGANSAQVVR